MYRSVSKTGTCAHTYSTYVDVDKNSMPSQGVMMGVLTAAGSLARAIGPMGVGFLYQHYGPLVTFSSMVGLQAATIVFILVTFSRLIPYSRYAGTRDPLVIP